MDATTTTTELSFLLGSRRVQGVGEEENGSSASPLTAAAGVGERLRRVRSPSSPRSPLLLELPENARSLSSARPSLFCASGFNQRLCIQLCLSFLDQISDHRTLREQRSSTRCCCFLFFLLGGLGLPRRRRAVSREEQAVSPLLGNFETRRGREGGPGTSGEQRAKSVERKRSRNPRRSALPRRPLVLSFLPLRNLQLLKLRHKQVEENIVDPSSRATKRRREGRKVQAHHFAPDPLLPFIKQALPLPPLTNSSSPTTPARLPSLLRTRQG